MQFWSNFQPNFSAWCLKVRLHGTRQAARDMRQHDVLRSNSIYMVGSSRARLLHIIHVSAFFGVGVLQRKWGNCSRQHVPRGNYKFKLKLPPGLAAVARLLRALASLDHNELRVNYEAIDVVTVLDIKFMVKSHLIALRVQQIWTLFSNILS